MCDAMSHYAQGAVDAVLDDCDDVEDILDRLDVAYHHLARGPFEGISQIPHADEIRQTINQTSQGGRDRYSKIFVIGIRQAMLTAQSAFEAADITLEDLSVLIKSRFTYMKAEARDVGHLNALYETLKKALKPTLGVT